MNIRIPEDILERVDVEVAQRRKEPGVSVDRSKVIRMALARGLSEMEAARANAQALADMKDRKSKGAR